MTAEEEIETIQLCAIGEQLSDRSITHISTLIENERFELAAAFGHSDQA